MTDEVQQHCKTLTKTEKQSGTKKRETDRNSNRTIDSQLNSQNQQTKAINRHTNVKKREVVDRACV
jgi:hypothetical protein